ncbi:hypothetical protein HZS_4650 [Henneguya salminicola]|nr:hypothetical protein HZS_4650 [Henneguya salminicola]
MLFCIDYKRRRIEKNKLYIPLEKYPCVFCRCFNGQRYNCSFLKCWNVNCTHPLPFLTHCCDTICKREKSSQETYINQKLLYLWIIPSMCMIIIGLIVYIWRLCKKRRIEETRNEVKTVFFHRCPFVLPSYSQGADDLSDPPSYTSKEVSNTCMETTIQSIKNSEGEN